MPSSIDSTDKPRDQRSNRPEFIYFDLGNVLCFFDHALSAAQMAEVAGVSPERMRAIVYESDLEHRYERGDISGDRFVEEVSRQVGKELCQERLLEAASAMFSENIEIVPVLEALKRNGIRMGLLSNTNEAHWNWICRQKYLAVEGWFDPILLSYEVNSMKPEEKIYRVATELAGVSSNSIFFTDDRHDNIQGAADFGWQTHPFESVEQLKRELNACGIL